MGYWYDIYGKRSKDFIEGVIAGVSTFAVRKGGIEYVGIMQTLLKEVITEIKKDLTRESK